MRRFYAMVCVLLFCFLTPAQAEEAGPLALLEAFEGEWRSNDPAFGGPAQTTMRWSRTLDGKFMRLDYRIEMRPETENAALFEGVAYYRLEKGDELRAFWADNSGDLHPIRAERKDDGLHVEWGVEGAKQGRTLYNLVRADEMQVTDWIRAEDGWRQFNDNRFARSVAP